MGLLLLMGARGLTYADRFKQTQPSSLIGYYSLNDPSGATATDSSGANRHGTYINVNYGVPGIDGALEAIRLSQTGYVNLSGSGLPAAFNPSVGSMLVWIRVAEAAWTDATIRRAVTMQLDSNNRVYVQRESGDDQLTWTYSAGGVHRSYTQNRVSSSWGGWLLLAITWSKASDRVRCYLNGTQAGGHMTGLGVWSGGAPSVALLGAGDTVPSQPWDGDLQHAAFWAVELTPAEVASLHQIRRSNVVWEGDSLTFGSGATPETSYPAQAIRKLAGSWKAKNVGASGQTIASMIADAATQVDPLFDPAALRNICVLFGGANDLGSVDASTVNSRLQQYCLDRRAAGWKTIVCTLPAGDPTNIPDYNIKRNAINTLIYANWSSYADGLADLAANANIGQDGDEANLTYYTADKLHLTATGYAEVATVVAEAIEAP